MNAISPRTYWKESTLTRNKLFYLARANQTPLRHFLDHAMFDAFLLWIETAYPHESTAWLLEDWLTAYIEYDGLV